MLWIFKYFGTFYIYVKNLYLEKSSTKHLKLVLTNQIS